MKTILVLLMMILFLGFDVFASDSKQKTQKIDFEEEMIDGQVRKPDGSYVVQKRSVDFVPLYRVREHFDENIKQSIEYLK